jgi:cyclic lactone autoinducer peptide
LVRALYLGILFGYNQIVSFKNNRERRSAMGEKVVNSIAKMIARIVITDAKLNVNAASSVGMYQPVYPKSMELFKKDK